VAQEGRCVVVDGRVALLPALNEPEAMGAMAGDPPDGTINPISPAAVGRVLREIDGNVSCCCGRTGTCAACCSTPLGCLTAGEPGDRLVVMHMHLAYRYWPEVAVDERCPNRPAPGNMFDPNAEPAQVEFWSQQMTLVEPVSIDGGRGIFVSRAAIIEREYRGGGPVINGDPRRCDCASSPVACFDQTLDFEREDEHAHITPFGHWLIPESAYALPPVQVEDRDERWRQIQNWNANDELNARIHALPPHALTSADYAIDTGTVQLRRDGVLRESWARIAYSVSVAVERNGPRCDAACRHCLSARERVN